MWVSLGVGFAPWTRGPNSRSTICGKWRPSVYPLTRAEIQVDSVGMTPGTGPLTLIGRVLLPGGGLSNDQCRHHSR
jgi:hypothetical protein